MERRPREFWERHVRGFGGSGQTRRAYCAAHGLNCNTLDAWRRRLATVFVPVQVRGVAPERTRVALRWPSGVELLMPRDCDPAWLAQVLSGLH